jgi:hypothetical protein
VCASPYHNVNSGFVTKTRSEFETEHEMVLNITHRVIRPKEMLHTASD